MKEDDFEDLVSTQGFGSRSDKKGPRTIAEMRRQEMTKDVDPLKLQVTNIYTPLKRCAVLRFLNKLNVVQLYLFATGWGHVLV